MCVCECLCRMTLQQCAWHVFISARDLSQRECVDESVTSAVTETDKNRYYKKDTRRDTRGRVINTPSSATCPLRDMCSPSTHDTIMAMRSVPFAKSISRVPRTSTYHNTMQWHARNKLRYAFCLPDEGPDESSKTSLASNPESTKSVPSL